MVGQALSTLCHVQATLDRGPLTKGSGRFVIFPKPIYSAGDMPLYSTAGDLHDLAADPGTGELPPTCTIGLEDEEYPFIEYFGPPEQMADVMTTIHQRMTSWQAQVILENTLGAPLQRAS